jgi:hypothetical protein
LPWSIELIEKYEDKWNWSILSWNEALHLSIELIEKFKERWDWNNLSRNESLPWSIELIEKYKWYWSCLSINEALYHNVFQPHLSDSFIEEIMLAIEQ